MRADGNLVLALPDELVERIAERAAEIMAKRQAPVEDGWLRGAVAIGNYIGAMPDRVYALSSAGRIPAEHDGAALVAKRSDLDAWIRSGGGKRP